MDILYLMIICSVSLAVIFLIIFIISARNGQFEDDESPAVRILLDSEIIKEDSEVSKETESVKKLDQRTEEKSD
ncbi:MULTISPECIES: cbb3-type cytochrome oxidase assembly protein CcoS [unclassified Kaistella]|uniref:cbb3-type cytochrome oxidase assembly protein CcoS n=1 Tax=unclassified Kaistella TaxID=2762626 RepID=UPI002736B772|nr:MULTISPECIES: cbb3-type cytochrome oxidase assembly protein CcoS [unclassified Kaistella]MCZ2083805.1 cbb3-type cytochrome oxidase assembly protein CcoS [Flavobacteriales bacterium]MDP2452763.1 cbb3-type cytochrome oxidase assembly protein CcoS [Kaistella sp. SH11-4b]MDP2455672.1 cbb3-type cytochrome oxidase assembly protein CcoS [Kaistella sp. SH40-3]MDP2458576.1 cbb3-type cytochrome oxidase assembly protein CcoS [Kaistella sp. SH19-2b]